LAALFVARRRKGPPDRDASSLAKIFLAVSGSCDAGWTALFPNFRGCVFADRERLYRIFALVTPLPATPRRARSASLAQEAEGRRGRLTITAGLN
jgi:hypothetical protein